MVTLLPKHRLILPKHRAKGVCDRQSEQYFPARRRNFCLGTVLQHLILSLRKRRSKATEWTRALAVRSPAGLAD